MASKFGSPDRVEELIENGSLTLVPVADCRGMSIKPGSGVYVTEAQNTSADIMKLLVQRVEEDCICIIEGDDRSQVDMISYQGHANGLRRLSQVFRGEPYYGEITLQKCHRSKMAERAELM